MFRIKTYNAIAPEGLALLSPDRYTLTTGNDADGFIIRSAKMADEVWGDNLLAIARAGAGVNNVPLDRANAAGVAVFNTPGGNANAVKELVLATLLMDVRPLNEAIAYANQAAGADVSLRTEQNKFAFRGSEIAGRRLTVIGLGQVGGRVANAAADLGMVVTGYDPTLTADAAWRLSDGVQRADHLADAVTDADYVTVHVPYSTESHHLVSSEILAVMPAHAVLLNFARLNIVDDAAALAALAHKKLAHYYTDFGHDALVDQPKVTVLPHIGGSTLEAEVTSAKMAATELRTFLETGNTTNSVNFPLVNEPFTTPWRLTVSHDNVPNMLGKISSILAAENVNIDHLINRSRQAHAYTVVEISDWTCEQQAAVQVELAQVAGINRVRVITKGEKA